MTVTVGSMPSLAKTAVAGLLSTGLSKVILAGAGFVVTAILARELEPSDFGLIGMAGVCTAFLSMLGSLGFDSAIVRTQEISQRQISTLFWIRLFVGILCAALLVAAAPWIASFYRESRLQQIVTVLSLIFVVTSLNQVHRSLLRKKLRFSQIAVNTVVSVVVSGCVGVAFALTGCGVWSLVGQALTLEIVSTILYWSTSKWRPSLVFVWGETLPLIRFGLSMAAGTFVSYIQRNIDSLLIGRLLGASALGYYALAYRIMYSPVRQVSYVFTDVLFPTLSTIQDDINALRRAYCKTVKSIGMVTFPTMTIVTLFSYEFVVNLFGEQWAPAATVIAILAPAGAIQSITQITYVVFTVLGRPKLRFVQYLIGSALLALGVTIGAPEGVTGVAWGVLTATCIAWCSAQFIVGRLLQMSWSDVFATLGKALASCCVMAASNVLVINLIGHQRMTGNFVFILILLSACLYCITTYFLDKKELISLTHLVKGVIHERLRSRQHDPSSPKVETQEIA